MARIFIGLSFAGDAKRLAWITGREDMNSVAPRLAVERFEIVPYKCRSQGLVCHPRHESGRSVGFPLDETHSSIGWLGNGEAEVETAISGAERKAEQFGGRFGT